MKLGTVKFTNFSHLFSTSFFASDGCDLGGGGGL